MKDPIAPHTCRYSTKWNTNAREQAIIDKLHRGVATYLRCGGIVNNRIKKGLLLSLPVIK